MAPKVFEGDGDDVVWKEDSPLTELLGFDFSAEDGQDRSGLKALINSAVVSHKRMPMLDVIFDRTARLMSTSLRQLTNENIEVTLDNVSSVRFGEFIQAQSAAGVIGVIHSKSFDGYALLAADSPLVHSVVDLLLGGRRSSGTGVEGRALTAIELGLAERMLKTLIDDFGEAFAPVADAAFALDRVETTPRFAAIAQDASVCTLAKFKIRLEEMTTRATILVPHAMIEPVREKLLCDFIGESGAADEIWKRRLGAGVSASGVELAAVLADRSMTIGDLRALKIGETLKFAANVGARVELRAGALSVAKGRVGRMGELVAVKIDAALAKPESEMEPEAAA
ncbi:MAG: FliM/FliN family flagellar motor switch protein [Parvularculaceae bacterium]|nr:FliM/FliN family flagellar motor switch protein [Parvularculaceae bacterium]